MGQTPQAPKPSPPAGSSGGLEPNIAALLGYLLLVPAILWLVLDPYKNDRFIRFHAFQALGLGAICIGLSIVLTIASIVIAFIPVINLLLPVVWLLLWLAILIFWILVMVKAYNREMYKLPVIGDFAMKAAG